MCVNSFFFRLSVFLNRHTRRALLEMDPSIKPPTDDELKCVNELKKVVTPHQLDAGDTYFLSDTTYLRFARARDNDLGKSLAMLEECVKWRREYKPYLITEHDVADILQLGTVFMAGLCVHQRPVVYMTPGAKNPFPAETRVKLIVFLLEETMRRGQTTLTWIFDFSKMGERGKDEHSRVTGKSTMHILQHYYPERLGALYMINTPWYFRAIATLMWPFIDKRTRQKLYLNVKVKHLTQYVQEDELIEAFGGKRVVAFGERGAAGEVLADDSAQARRPPQEESKTAQQ